MLFLRAAAVGVVLGLFAGAATFAVAHFKVIYGGPGDNDIFPRTPDGPNDTHEHGDLVQAREGRDNVGGGHGDDELNGQDGGDSLIGAEGDDVIEGDDQIDVIEGREDRDTIRGGNSNDSLEGLGANDTMAGGDGDFDFIDARDGSPNDTALGGPGNDDTCQLDYAFGFAVDNFEGCENLPGGG